MKTTQITREEGLKRRVWYVIDAKDQILGRMCVHIANLLRGKNKPDFTPNQDCGDFVVVINASKVRLTGDKADKEIWYRHSGYPGGLKSRKGKEMIEKYSDKLVHKAVKGMLPKNKTLSHTLLHKLHVYPDAEYKKHEAQKPINYQIT
ncbi:50S ribosomal protein L13 [Candidatus Mycoplasma haematohominis]|uniref:Large ribosomal subunit protein uL13 n=1 Tax=Candidatus Mycoplasma haematohominis TaxID=1494318 RepID=A0A478FTS1_9MOLU|nr:50S ribosomal protein L13 [Candidatus Mycoplasma haemohominis]GCE63430.1 50S ribosomal protein L13 [Candidatus Mycoplasma haemohominis]